MSQAKVSSTDYLDFLIATPRNASALEAVRTQPDTALPVARINVPQRWLHQP